jgi:hypothetical protein
MLIIIKSPDFKVFHQQHHPSQSSMTKKHFVPLSQAGQVSIKPLLRGWERKQNPDGKEYYVDHNTKTVTWQRPETDIMTVPSDVHISFIRLANRA